MQHNKIITLLFLFSLNTFVLNADYVHSEPLIKFEDGVESEARFTAIVRDWRDESSHIDRDVTHEYAFRGVQDNVGWSYNRSDLLQDNGSDNTSSYNEKSDSNHNSHEANNFASSIEFSTWEPQDDMREARYCIQMESVPYAREEPEANYMKVKKEPQALEKLQLLSVVKWPDAMTVDEECYLWEQELECWKGEGLKEAQRRIENRIAAYQNCKDNPLNRKEYRYDLSSDAKTYLYKNQINAAIFENGLYNEIQHQLHLELLDIAEEFTRFDVNVCYPGAFKLVNVDVARIAATGV